MAPTEWMKLVLPAPHVTQDLWKVPSGFGPRQRCGPSSLIILRSDLQKPTREEEREIRRRYRKYMREISFRELGHGISVHVPNEGIEMSELISAKLDAQIIPH